MKEWDVVLMGHNRQIAWSNRIEFERASIIRFCPVNIGITSRVDDDLRVMGGNGVTHLIQSGNIEFRVFERNDLVTCQNGLQRTTELPSRACDQDPHPNSSPKNVP